MWMLAFLVLLSTGLVQAEDPCAFCSYVPMTSEDDTTCATPVLKNDSALFLIRSSEGDNCFYIFGGCLLYQAITTTNECIEFDDIVSKNVCRDGNFYLYGTEKAVKSIGCASH